ncbi:Thiol-disulfide oxidoreductase ResA [uncultured archaeon]|nr:Thiol-disulfide oxidoreductase ResA [uncultured archaeon]
MVSDDNSWLLVLLILLAGGIAFFLLADAVNPSSTQFSAIPKSVPSGANLSFKEAHFQRAPVWSSYEGVINGPNGDSLSSSDLGGKVYLLDFWTYSCINCIRTLPYIESWQQRYGPQGLVIVGIHSPEFDFEKNRTNVEAAIKRFNLTTIDVLDGEHRIWNAWGNAYWPNKFLIDGDGFIRYNRIGEGGYDETEAAIRALLAERNNSMPSSPMAAPVLTSIDKIDFSQVGTPELYLGGNFRRAPLGNAPVTFITGAQSVFSPSDSLTPNLAYLNGTWSDEGDGLRLVSDTGDILLNYRAKDVHLVAEAGASGPTSAMAYVDNILQRGPDADASGSVSFGPSRLYSMTSASDYGARTLRIHITGAGLKAYSFTFG